MKKKRENPIVMTVSLLLSLTLLAKFILGYHILSSLILV